MQPHVFDSAVTGANQWLEELRQALDLPADGAPRALHALRAGLHAIRDRLPAAEVVHLGAQLPALIRGIYYDGWRLANDPTEIRDRAQMIARVERELAPDHRLEATDVLRGVIGLLVEHVSSGEVLDILDTLPRPVRSLWQDLTGHALDTLDPRHPPRASHRTGYSR